MLMEDPTEREKLRMQESEKMSDAPRQGERMHSEPKRRVKPWTGWKALHIRLEAALRIHKHYVFTSSPGKRQQSYMRVPGKLDRWLGCNGVSLAGSRSLKGRTENIWKEGEGGRGEIGA